MTLKANTPYITLYCPISSYAEYFYYLEDSKDALLCGTSSDAGYVVFVFIVKTKKRGNILHEFADKNL